jgi:hypothetical protein
MQISLWFGVIINLFIAGIVNDLEPLAAERIMPVLDLI